MSYIYLIKENYPFLTKSEKKVADFILNSGKTVIYSTMSDIKKNTKVGDATIIRFCQKIGFSGFSDLKIEIAKEDFSQKKEHPTSVKYYDEIANSLTEALYSTIRLLDEEKLNEAIKMITQSKNIYIFGVGSSGNTSLDLENMFLRVGVQAKAVLDPHFQAQVASLLTVNDLVIIFSLSGKTKDTYDSLKIAKKNGAKIIAITNYIHSPIGKSADLVLQTAIEEFLNGGSLAGKISQLYICDLLVHGYEQNNNIDSVELREKVLRSIIDKSIE
ncbi:MurR/RpiR family transcriptional regulator [Enterococcus faecium]|uniref:MurR/RpiR family transcriptional regulator n=1 Tax=Enterococcus faecium TaxID=1352 RepID=UPI0006B28C89|nr:MurR/RpiR family transcriptional regulator [Enterococcus faecium]EMF0614717.1 MurR/RpiR family transcriptional regulator [Enterococcus faecium]MDQ8536068.1 MurR/RpiR family transcriptional regulator [Enterococcus faecium]NTJ98356.1 MurR/RpiR family transcriptional regulator [Enterococcus faecium]